MSIIPGRIEAVLGCAQSRMPRRRYLGQHRWTAAYPCVSSTVSSQGIEAVRDSSDAWPLAGHAVVVPQRRLVPGSEFLLNEEGRSGPVNLWIEWRRVQRRHKRAMLHHQQDLGKASDASGALAMADIAFD